MRSRPTTETPLAHWRALPAVAKNPAPKYGIIEKQHRSGEKLTILVVDSDLGFLCWLGCLLSAAGHVPLPAVNSHGALELLRCLKVGIDLLVVNYSIPGASELAASLGRSQMCLKVIAVVDNEPGPPFRRADASQDTRSGPDEALGAQWLESIEAVFAYVS